MFKGMRAQESRHDVCDDNMYYTNPSLDSQQVILYSHSDIFYFV